MIIQCESCSRKFVVKDMDIPSEGRVVQCGYCSVTWHQMPAAVQHPASESQVAIFQNDPVSNSKYLLLSIDQWSRLIDLGFFVKNFYTRKQRSNVTT